MFLLPETRVLKLLALTQIHGHPHLATLSSLALLRSSLRPTIHRTGLTVTLCAIFGSLQWITIKRSAQINSIAFVAGNSFFDEHSCFWNLKLADCRLGEGGYNG